MDLFVIIFLFLLAACVGSFLNVVIYRVPRGQSIVFPGSHCPVCGRGIRWYDNIPLLSWLALRGHCRFCKTPISPRYIIIEAVTALLVVGLYIAYFILHVRAVPPHLAYSALNFMDAWPMFTAHAALLCGLLVCSAVDIEMWLVPLEVTWVVAIIGIVAAAAAPHPFMPTVSAGTGAIGLAAVVGLVAALVLMKLGYLQQSFIDATDAPIIEPPAPKPMAPADEPKLTGKQARKARKAALKAKLNAPPEEPAAASLPVEAKSPDRPHAVAMTSANGVNPRVEVLRELLFLTPAIVLAVTAWAMLKHVPAAAQVWNELLSFSHHPMLAPHLVGALAAIWGYLIGGLWIWGTRILGTLAFGKEAMGMGDVHIMACVGAVCGWIVPSVAFFVAPFMGLLWALWLLARRGQRELPYGPWLAIASVVVMIFYDFFHGMLRQYAQVLSLLQR